MRMDCSDFDEAAGKSRRVAPVKLVQAEFFGTPWTTITGVERLRLRWIGGSPAVGATHNGARTCGSKHDCIRKQQTNQNWRPLVFAAFGIDVHPGGTSKKHHEHKKPLTGRVFVSITRCHLSAR